MEKGQFFSVKLKLEWESFEQILKNKILKRSNEFN